MLTRLAYKWSGVINKELKCSTSDSFPSILSPEVPGFFISEHLFFIISIYLKTLQLQKHKQSFILAYLYFMIVLERGANGITSHLIKMLTFRTLRFKWQCNLKLSVGRPQSTVCDVRRWHLSEIGHQFCKNNQKICCIIIRYRSGKSFTNKWSNSGLQLETHEYEDTHLLFNNTSCNIQQTKLEIRVNFSSHNITIACHPENYI